MKRRSSFHLCVVTSLLLSSCAPKNLPKAGQVNQTITAAIADAGAAAIQAEQEYTSGQIPQTPAIRVTINDLGAAYNEAKAVYLIVLGAQAQYNAAELAQVTACSPPPAGSTAPASPGLSCPQATQNAAAAKQRLDADSAKLNGAISTMVTKTSAVKAIRK